MCLPQRSMFVTLRLYSLDSVLCVVVNYMVSVPCFRQTLCKLWWKIIKKQQYKFGCCFCTRLKSIPNTCNSYKIFEIISKFAYDGKFTFQLRNFAAKSNVLWQLRGSMLLASFYHHNSVLKYTFYLRWKNEIGAIFPPVYFSKKKTEISALRFSNFRLKLYCICVGIVKHFKENEMGMGGFV